MISGLDVSKIDDQSMGIGHTVTLMPYFANPVNRFSIYSFAMKAVIQRVDEASVTVDGETVGEIGRGLCVLVGVDRDDIPLDTNYIAQKIVNIRLFDNEGVAWAKSAKDLGLDILLVSQFTLCSTLKGNKPDFHQAMSTEAGKVMFDSVVDAVQKAHTGKVATGQFGAHMKVGIVNDGPVTINLNSRREVMDDTKYDRLGRTNVEKFFKQQEREKKQAAEKEARRIAKAERRAKAKEEEAAEKKE